MKDVAADKAEIPFEVERREDLPRNYGSLKSRRVSFDRLDHQIGDDLARLVP